MWKGTFLEKQEKCVQSRGQAGLAQRNSQSPSLGGSHSTPGRGAPLSSQNTQEDQEIQCIRQENDKSPKLNTPAYRLKNNREYCDPGTLARPFTEPPHSSGPLPLLKPRPPLPPQHSHALSLHDSCLMSLAVSAATIIPASLTATQIQAPSQHWINVHNLELKYIKIKLTLCVSVQIEVQDK